MKNHESREPVRCRFDDYELRSDTRELRLDGRPVPIGGRAFDLLVGLVRGRGQTVGKDALIEAVWPGRVVIENNLNAQVLALRRLLGPRAVLTVPGRGFRFGIEVHHELPLLHAPGPLVEPPAVAVLPF